MTLEALTVEHRGITLGETKEEMELGISFSALSHIIRNKRGYRYKKDNPCERTGSTGMPEHAKVLPVVDI